MQAYWRKQNFRTWDGWKPIAPLPGESKVILGGMVATEDGSRLFLIPTDGPIAYFYDAADNSWSETGNLFTRVGG